MASPSRSSNRAARPRSGGMRTIALRLSRPQSISQGASVSGPKRLYELMAGLQTAASAGACARMPAMADIASLASRTRWRVRQRVAGRPHSWSKSAGGNRIYRLRPYTEYEDFEPSHHIESLAGCAARRRGVAGARSTWRGAMSPWKRTGRSVLQLPILVS